MCQGERHAGADGHSFGSRFVYSRSCFVVPIRHKAPALSSYRLDETPPQ